MVYIYIYLVAMATGGQRIQTREIRGEMSRCSSIEVSCCQNSRRSQDQGQRLWKGRHGFVEDVGIATPNMSSIGFWKRNWLSSSVDRIEKTWANNRMEEFHYISRGTYIAPIRDCARLQTTSEKCHMVGVIRMRGVSKSPARAETWRSRVRNQTNITNRIQASR